MDIPHIDTLDVSQIIADHYPEFTGIHPACEAVPMIDNDGFIELVNDISTQGLKNPILRMQDGMLLDGRTRLLACYVAMAEIRVTTDNGVVNPWEQVNSLNMKRRHLTVGQRAMFGDAWRLAEDDAAREREHAGRPKKGMETFPEVNGGTSRDKTGEKVGVSGKTMDKARIIKQHAPEVAKLVSSGKRSLEDGFREANAIKKAKESLPFEAEFRADTNNLAVIVTSDGAESEISLPKTVRFNSTNDSVDWANWTWNPVTGCEHGCKFCYAREIANSDRMKPYYPNGFKPTFHEYRLSAPANTKVPDTNEARDGRVFVCSMADLFGKWVPNEWIEKVFKACLESPQWEYLFLTKWPERYSRMPLIERAWYGSSIIQQSDVSRVEKCMSKFSTPNSTKWISLEPMLGPIKFNDLSWCDLVVVGSQTSTVQPEGPVPAFAPKFDWIVDVVNQCREFGVPYYLKENLGMTSPGMELPKPLPRNAQ